MSDLPPPPPPPPPPPGAGGEAGTTDPRAGTAGFWLRVAAVVIDALVVGVPVALFVRSLGFRGDAAELAETFVTLVAGALYFPLLEGGPRGQTVGKRLCGIRVVDDRTRGTITVGRALVRYLVSLLSGCACLVGYLWMLFDPARQTWHDKAARTLVVRI